jgi:hypothetical protein
MENDARDQSSLKLPTEYFIDWLFLKGEAVPISLQ